MWNAGQFQAFDNVDPALIIGIRNELANDGLIYVNNVKPIFTETLGNSISFFDSWSSQYSTIEDFNQNLTII